MNRFVEKLYFFTKFTTSLILLVFVIFLSYLLIISYKNTISSKVDFSSVVNPLNLKIEQNHDIYKKNSNALSSKLNALDMKTENIEQELSSINLNLANIYELKNQIALLQNKINQISLSDLSEDQNQDISKINISEKEKLKEIIIVKFKNNLNYKQELNLLQSLSGVAKKPIFEKLTLTTTLEFIGIDELKKSYIDLTDQFIKNSIKKDDSIFPDFIIDLVTIGPSSNVEYSNQNIYYLKSAKNYLTDENILDAISSIKNITEYEKYFSKWIEQADIYVSFIEQIERI